MPEAAPPPALASAAADSTQVPPASGSGIILRAKSETWLQIRDTQDKSVLVSRTLQAGEEFRVPDRPNLVMTTGNAGGLEITIDGETLPPLGRAGAVRRNVALEVEPLRAATAVLN
jgi:cytoskeleton protein RodZ